MLPRECLVGVGKNCLSYLSAFDAPLGNQSFRPIASSPDVSVARANSELARTCR